MDDPAKPVIEYEETPILKPIVDVPVLEKLTSPLETEKDLPDPLDRPEIPEHSQHGRKKTLPILSDIVIFSVLFTAGIIGSMFLRPYLSNVSIPSVSNIQPTPSVRVVPTGSVDAIPAGAAWKPYVFDFQSSGVSYALPEGVLAPVCDGERCLSKGTYLPGGTRLTISIHTPPEPTANFSNLIIKDAAGRQFDTEPQTVAGFPAVSFTGTFTGSTTGGYSFTRMHGVMILISQAIMLEMNHFAPNGITSDFPSDDTLFMEILNTVQTVRNPSPATK